jgi:hypothetical protein
LSRRNTSKPWLGLHRAMRRTLAGVGSTLFHPPPGPPSYISMHDNRRRLRPFVVALIPNPPPTRPSLQAKPCRPKAKAEPAPASALPEGAPRPSARSAAFASCRAPHAAGHAPSGQSRPPSRAQTFPSSLLGQRCNALFLVLKNPEAASRRFAFRLRAWHAKHGLLQVTSSLRLDPDQEHYLCSRSCKPRRRPTTPCAGCSGRRTPTPAEAYPPASRIALEAKASGVAGVCVWGLGPPEFASSLFTTSKFAAI